MKWLAPLIFASLPAAAADREPMGVRVSLVSENTAIAAGRTFTVGLRIHHLEGYHTYWQNPGIAGVATSLAWRLPEGFSAGPIQWPVPEKVSMAGHPVHGYERDIILLVDIRAPERIETQSVKLVTEAAWMACERGCYPGRKSLEIELPVTSTPAADAALAGAFAKARAELPGPLDGKFRVEIVSPRDSKEIQLCLKPASAPFRLPESCHFFSSDGQVSSDQPQRFEPGSDGSLRIFLSRSAYSPEGKRSLPGVLACGAPLDASGRTWANVEPLYPPGH